MNETLKTILTSSQELMINIDKLVRELALENSQEFLNWQDDLNALSVK